MAIHAREVARRAEDSVRGGGFDMTSMIDVTFLLIVFFMCVTELNDLTRPPVDLPVASEAEPVTVAPGRLVLSIRADGRCEAGGETMTPATLAPLLFREAALGADRAVMIRADATVPFGEVQRVLGACRDAGLWRIAFATKDPEAVR